MVMHLHGKQESLGSIPSASSKDKKMFDDCLSRCIHEVTGISEIPFFRHEYRKGGATAFNKAFRYFLIEHDLLYYHERVLPPHSIDNKTIAIWKWGKESLQSHAFVIDIRDLPPKNCTFLGFARKGSKQLAELAFSSKIDAPSSNG